MKLPAINLNGTELSHLDKALRKEWLLTNGLGGYASSTILGLNTRKYHGLLVAALHPPGDRTVCIAKIDEDIIVENKIQQINANEFQNEIYPQGFQLQKAFSISPFPTYNYEVDRFKIKKTVAMPKGRNAIAIIYRAINRGKQDINFRAFPLLTCRSFHNVVDRHQRAIDPKQEGGRRQVELIFASPKATIAVASTEGIFIEKPNWVDRLLYREEVSRGESSLDDLYQPGFFEVKIPPNTLRQFAIVGVADEDKENAEHVLNSYGNEIHEVTNLLAKELKQEEVTLEGFYSSHPQMYQSNWLSCLILAANTFLVKSYDGDQSIIAGYHWFEAWGRDAFVSLPGLTLVTGRIDDAKRILKFFSINAKQGLIPNLIPDRAREPAYNTVDASLWYINAILQYLKYTNDFEFVYQNLWESLKVMVDSYEKGTLFGIHMDTDGLISHSSQLTWMDAEVNNAAVTPRSGKAVEIQALWYNALKIMQILGYRFGENKLGERYLELAEKTRETFNTKFWNEERKCLFDVIGAESDPSIRPNQIIALALDFPIAAKEKAEEIIGVTSEELLTPFGLRTLNKADPKYRGNYFGNRSSRDQAYHNGTVWAWLIGPFTTAYLRAKGNNHYVREKAAMFIEPLLSQQVLQAGLGTVSEIFDGDPPHTPRGCISQAWSVAEPLRAYVEDVKQIRPKHEEDVLLLRA